MNGLLDCIQIWQSCSLGISNDLVWDESIENKIATAAILKKIDIVGMGIIFSSFF